ncbi:hypothetical protein AB0B35_42115, partial [Catellatospora sp. NPDC049133]
ASGLPPLVSGGLGALVTTVVYAVLWHLGLVVGAARRPRAGRLSDGAPVGVGCARGQAAPAQ